MNQGDPLGSPEPIVILTTIQKTESTGSILEQQNTKCVLEKRNQKYVLEKRNQKYVLEKRNQKYVLDKYFKKFRISNVYLQVRCARSALDNSLGSNKEKELSRQTILKSSLFQWR